MQTSVRTSGHWARAAVLAAAAASALVAGCGGGSSGAIPLPTIQSVKVMGDSLADVGTLGIRFTVQGTATEPRPIFPELVAQSYGLARQCNFYTFNGTSFAPNATAGCTNFAIGGGRINGTTGGFVAADPRNIVVQLQTAVAAKNHTANDLLLIDGGGNDAADIVGLYLAIGRAAAVSPAAQAAAVTAYGQALNSIPLLSAVNLTSAQGLAEAGGIYMRSLAAHFHGQIKTHALDKGAQYVALVNMPAITLTPRFQAVLAGIAAANGGGTTGATASATAATLFDSWVSAFNAELASRVAGNRSVLLIDLNSVVKAWTNNPATFGFTNVKDASCPVTGTGSDGLPTYSIATCSANALSSRTPPAGATGGSGWWTTFLYSDDFHPSPLGHQLAYEQIRLALFNYSWQ
jgi:outer membrane lipase/esterase